MNIYEVIKKPLITEKTTLAKDSLNAVSFVVNPDSNKLEIKEAVSQLFNVKVLDVRTSIVRGKIKRAGRFAGKRSNWKKAIVSLDKDSSIDFFEL